MPQVLAWPLRRDPATGGLATVDSGSVDVVAQEVAIVLLTRPGERTWLPRFGAPSPLGQAAVDADVARRAVEEWAPGAASVEVVASRSRADPLRWSARIRIVGGV